MGPSKSSSVSSSNTRAAISPATKNTFSAIHTTAIGEVMQFMAGLYTNVEDSLFEMAFSNGSPIQQRHIGELMKELRFRRSQLLKSFAGRLKDSESCWWGEPTPGPELMEERILAQRMASKCKAHFDHLLSDVSQRVQDAIGENGPSQLPVSPEQLCYHFLMSCRSVSFEKYSLEVISDLFARFVLDRLGNVYGSMNLSMQQAGYRNAEQVAAVSATA